MEEKDFIKELFQEKLAQHQSPVSPELWASVSSSIKTGSAVVSSGLSVLTKSIIGGLSAAAVIGGVWMLTQQKTSSTKTVRSKEIKKTSTQTKSTDEKAVIKLSKPAKIYEHVFLIPEIPQEDNGPAFGPGTLHSGFGSASCGPANSLTNKEFEGMPILPLQTTVSDQNITVISDNSLANQVDQIHQESNSIEQDEIIILPNIFSPNGDGKNDVFSIDLGAFEFADYSLVILDLNNQVVFKSNDPLESWNGKKVDGEVCSMGTYVYYLTGKTVAGKTISKYSTLRIQH
jgi:gliding motility-associated-like protein